MTTIEKKGFYSSLIFTSVFFLLMILGCIFIKVKEKPVYKTLQISLAKPLVAEKNIEKTAQKPAEKTVKEEQTVEKKIEKPIEKTEAKPVQKNETKPLEKEVKKSNEKVAETNVQKKTEAAKPKSNDKVVNTPVIKKSVEELAKEQNVVKKKVEWDDSLFDDDFNFETKETVKSNNVKTAQKSSLEGVAAVSENNSESSNNSVKSSSSANSSANNTSVNKSTLDALSEMENASVYASSGSTKSSEAKAQSSSASSVSTGHLSLEFNGGKTRKLISPSVLEINLSKESQRTLSVTTTVRITFVILPNGTVPVSDITFMPQGLLTSSVQNEIKNQIHTWNFSSDPSLSSTSASFDFTIVVK